MVSNLTSKKPENTGQPVSTEMTGAVCGISMIFPRQKLHTQNVTKLPLRSDNSARELHCFDMFEHLQAEKPRQFVVVSCHCIQFQTHDSVTSGVVTRKVREEQSEEPSFVVFRILPATKNQKQLSS